MAEGCRIDFHRHKSIVYHLSCAHKFQCIRITMHLFIHISYSMQSGIHLPKITIEYMHNNGRVLADLELNKMLLPEGHFLRYQDKNGSAIVQRFTQYDVDLCHYHVSYLHFLPLPFLCWSKAHDTPIYIFNVNPLRLSPTCRSIG